MYANRLGPCFIAWHVIITDIILPSGYIEFRGAISHGLKLPYARLRGKHIFPAPPICFHWLCPCLSACAYLPPPVPPRGMPHPHGGATWGRGAVLGCCPAGPRSPLRPCPSATPHPCPMLRPHAPHPFSIGCVLVYRLALTTPLKSPVGGFSMLR